MEEEKKPKSHYEPKYVCFNCGLVISWNELKKRIGCPKCGKNIFFKLRPEDRPRTLKAE